MADKPGHRFEREVATLFEKLGWEIQLTPTTGDLGADVVARCFNEIVVVQCKDWTGNVGFDAIKEVIAARQYYKASVAVVVSNSGYVKRIRELAVKMDVLLYTPSDLSIGSLLDRSEQGKRYKALQKFRKEEDEREAAYNQLVGDHERYEKAIAHNLACEKAKAPRSFKNLAALVAGIGASIVFNHPLAICLAGLYLFAEWMNADRPEDLPQKPKLPKPLAPFQRRSPPSFGPVVSPPNPIPPVQPSPVPPINDPPILLAPPLNGFGKKILPDGSTYEGSFENGKFNGPGVLVHSNATYKGFFVDNKKNGHGEMSWANGSKYIGTFKDDYVTGHGECVYSSGEKYLGEFLDSKKHGKGISYFADGQSYEGEYQNNKRHGYGIHVLARGSKYVGEFVDDRYEGLGIFYSLDGNIQNEGVWKEGKFVKSQSVKLSEDVDQVESTKIAIHEIYTGIQFCRTIDDYRNAFLLFDKDLLDVAFAIRRDLEPAHINFFAGLYFCQLVSTLSKFLPLYRKNIWEDRELFSDHFAVYLSREEHVMAQMYFERAREYLLLASEGTDKLFLCALSYIECFGIWRKPNFQICADALEPLNSLKSDPPDYENFELRNFQDKLRELEMSYNLMNRGYSREACSILDIFWPLSLVRGQSKGGYDLVVWEGNLMKGHHSFINFNASIGYYLRLKIKQDDLKEKIKFYVLGYNAWCHTVSKNALELGRFDVLIEVKDIIIGTTSFIIEDIRLPPKDPTDESYERLLSFIDPDLCDVGFLETIKETDLYAAYVLGFCYLYGVNTQVDFQKAEEIFKRIQTSKGSRTRASNRILFDSVKFQQLKLVQIKEQTRWMGKMVPLIKDGPVWS